MPTWESAEEAARALVDTLRQRIVFCRERRYDRPWADPDYRNYGEEYWREWEVMADECERAVPMVQETPPLAGESAADYLLRMKSSFQDRNQADPAQVIQTMLQPPRDRPWPARAAKAGIRRSGCATSTAAFLHRLMRRE